MYRSRYRFIRRLGYGLTSRVHLVEDIEANSLAAVKIVDRRIMQRIGRRLQETSGEDMLRREIAVLKKLEHPHIVKLYNVIDDGRSMHIVMEFVATCLADVKPPDDEVAATIVVGLVDALSYCHSHYVVHRDIKNANALLAADGVTAKLCDFGFATEWRGSEGSDVTLEDRRGTLLYMAPEMLKQEANTSPASPGQQPSKVTVPDKQRKCGSVQFEGTSADCWAMGVLVYQLVTGHKPFGSDKLSRSENKRAICTGTYNESCIPSDLCAEFCRKALTVDSLKRANADELLQCRWLQATSLATKVHAKRVRQHISVTPEEVKTAIATLDSVSEVGRLKMRARRLAVQSRHQSAVRIQAVARGRLTRQAPWRDERIMIKAKMKRKKTNRRSQAELTAGTGRGKSRKTPRQTALALSLQRAEEHTGAQAQDQVAVARGAFVELRLEDVSLSLLLQMTASQRLNLTGPTETSNWLVPGRVLVGSCPGTHCYTSGGDVVEGKKLRSSRETVLAELSALKDVGVMVFFNFQQRIEEKHCRPYYVNLLHEAYRDSTPNARIPSVHRYPTADGAVWPTRVMDNILNAIEAAMREDPRQVLYLHCYGGHGRVGTVAAALLYRLYNISAEDVLMIVQRNHECRRAVAQRSNRSPCVIAPLGVLAN
eukprot:COSAG02_NODE_1406_length_12786_cov_5.493418_8_plen_655_part_00